MGKLLKWILVPVLILALTGTVFAEENILKIWDAAAQKGKTVYVTVELTESVKGDSVGISYTYDEKCLTPIVESCSWVREGVLQDFDKRNHIGIWTVSQSEDLKGGVCVLAFEVNKRAKFTKTEVSCTVTVKNSGQTVGVYTAEGKIIMDCEHTYGQWTDGGDIGHSRSCNLCQGTQTQSHQWNDGIVTFDPFSGANVKTYTCQVCGGTVTYLTSEQETVSTLPEPNEPTAPQTEPHNTDPNQPGQNSSGNGHNSAPNLENSESVQGDHNEPSQGGTADTAPSVETQAHNHNQVAEETQAADPHAGHDHTQVEQGGNSWITAAAVFAILAAIVGTGIYFVKKKK